MRTLPLILVFIVPMLLAGCTVVRITGAHSATSVHFGVLKIAPETPGGMVAVDTTGFGLVPGAGGATLGFSRDRAVFMNDLSHCRLVIFEAGNDPQSRAFWAKALSDAQQLCIEGEDDVGEREN